MRDYTRVILLLLETFPFAGQSGAFLNSYWNVKVITVAAAVISIVVIVFVIVVSQIIVIRKRKKRRQREEEIRKVQVSRRSLAHSEDDRNPDLIPQSTGGVSHFHIIIPTRSTSRM